MLLNSSQKEVLAKYFSDLSKVLFATIIVGFFLPEGMEAVSLPVFAVGLATAVGFIAFSVKLLKSP